MAKELQDRKAKDKKKGRQNGQRSAPSRALLLGLGIGFPFLRRRIPEKGPHTIRIVT